MPKIPEMRIAMFCHNYPPHPGGLEVMVESLARELAARHQVTIVTSAWRAKGSVSHEDGLTVHRVPTWHFTEDWGVPYPIPRGRGITRALAQIRNAQVIHAHGALYAMSVVALRAARRAAAPLILTEHVGFVDYSNLLVNGIEHAAWGLIGNRVLDRTRSLVVYNRRVEQWMRSRFPSKDVTFIGNGVDLENFRPPRREDVMHSRRALGLPVDRPLALFVGRDAPKKNLAAIVGLDRRSYTLVICGAERALAGENLINLGLLPHARMAELYACVDMMVLPSTGEGFPLAAQEALATGIPLVVLWDPGYEGSLSREAVIACDRLDEIGPSLESLARDPARRARYSQVARSWAEKHWSWHRTASRYERIYDAALRDPRHEREMLNPNVRWTG